MIAAGPARSRWFPPAAALPASASKCPPSASGRARRPPPRQAIRAPCASSAMQPAGKVPPPSRHGSSTRGHLRSAPASVPLVLQQLRRFSGGRWVLRCRPARPEPRFPGSSAPSSAAGGPTLLLAVVSPAQQTTRSRRGVSRLQTSQPRCRRWMMQSSTRLRRPLTARGCRVCPAAPSECQRHNITFDWLGFRSLSRAVRFGECQGCKTHSRTIFPGWVHLHGLFPRLRFSEW